MAEKTSLENGCDCLTFMLNKLITHYCVCETGQDQFKDESTRSSVRLLTYALLLPVLFMDLWIRFHSGKVAFWTSQTQHRSLSPPSLFLSLFLCHSPFRTREIRNVFSWRREPCSGSTTPNRLVPIKLPLMPRCSCTHPSAPLPLPQSFLSPSPSQGNKARGQPKQNRAKNMNFTALC